jgi:CRISPR-associated protein Cas5t
VYGFLLSLVGETDLQAHLGVKLAIGFIGDKPMVSKIVRKQRHHKFSKTHMGTYPSSKFSKPNHQELLTDLQIVLRVDSSEEDRTVTLNDRLLVALTTPDKITRFGGLSLGESWAMVNGIRGYRESDGQVSWLCKDNRGLISLPRWIDRVSTQGTFQRFSLADVFSEGCWVTIALPDSLKVVEQKKGRRG